MAKHKPRKPLGRFGRMNESVDLRAVRLEDLNDPDAMLRFGHILEQSRLPITMAIDELRKKGHPFENHVVVVADTTHENVRLILRDMEEPVDPNDSNRGLVSVIERSKVVTALRTCSVAEREVVEGDLPDGAVRILFLADTKMFCGDFRLEKFPPLPLGGQA